jgi:hypothetical protein
MVDVFAVSGRGMVAELGRCGQYVHTWCGGRLRRQFRREMPRVGVRRQFTCYAFGNAESAPVDRPPVGRRASFSV